MANLDEVMRKLEANRAPAENERSPGKDAPSGAAQTDRRGAVRTNQPGHAHEAARTDERRSRAYPEAESGAAGGTSAQGTERTDARTTPDMTGRTTEERTLRRTPRAVRDMREERRPPSVSERPSGEFNNRQGRTPTVSPPPPYRPPSRFWRDFTEGLPPLWGIDLVLILITVTGWGWILFHWSEVLSFLAGAVYAAISSALTPLFDILLFLLALAVIVAALRRMCAPRGLC